MPRFSWITQTSPFTFLVLGAGRGGTSVLAATLDAHSRIQMGMEMFSNEYLRGFSLKHIGYDAIIEERCTAFKEACEKEARHYRPLIWGNKITTEQLFGLEDYNSVHTHRRDVLDYFFKHSLPHIKIIFILRDGRGCVDSKVRRTGQPMELAVARWRYSVAVYRYLQEHHQDSTCFVRFEDLIRDSHQQLARVTEFIGVDYEEEMLAGTQSDRIPENYRRSQMDASVLSAPQLPECYLDIMKSDLQELGYI